MKTTKTAWELPEWLRSNYTIFGAEEPGDGGDGGTGDGDGGDDGDDDDNDDDDSGSDNSSDSGEKGIEALQRALAEERRQRKALEKKEKAREREANRKKSADDDALATAQRELEETSSKVGKLAAGYFKNAVDRAIESQARELKFKDPTDALALVDREMIDADQDEDDPSKVDIDKDSVKRAVKKLADAKKHLLQSGTEDGGPTGSSFGNSGKNGKKPTDEELLKQRYSALR